MDWKKFLKAGVAVVVELNDTTLTGAEKLEKLTLVVAAFLENVDDLAAFLPLGFGFVLNVVLDNPLTDALQKEYAAKPLAELLYQTWSVADAADGDIAAFTDGAPDLRGAPVPVV
jgi:hypothetical protein